MVPFFRPMNVYVAPGSPAEKVARVRAGLVFDAPWKNIVATFYHELNEARTDADVQDAIRAFARATQLLGWTSKKGEECGDFPVDEAGALHHLTLVFQEVTLTTGKGSVPIQFQYSNAVHGPEGPIPNPH